MSETNAGQKYNNCATKNGHTYTQIRTADGNGSTLSLFLRVDVQDILCELHCDNTKQSKKPTAP